MKDILLHMPRLGVFCFTSAACRAAYLRLAITVFAMATPRVEYSPMTAIFNHRIPSTAVANVTAKPSIFSSKRAQVV